MRAFVLAAVVSLTLSPAQAQVGPEADALSCCLADVGISMLRAGNDVDTAFAGAWTACDAIADLVPVEYDGIDFDGLEGIDESFFHLVLGVYEDRAAGFFGARTCSELQQPGHDYQRLIIGPLPPGLR